MWQTMKEIYYESGIGEFYKGVIPNMILVINPIINYVIYEACKKTLTSAGFSETSAIAIFISSSAGKILATFATYPIITVRIKLQTSNTSRTWDILKSNNFFDYFRGI